MLGIRSCPFGLQVLGVEKLLPVLAKSIFELGSLNFYVDASTRRSCVASTGRRINALTL